MRWKLSLRSLSEDLVPARHTPNVGKHLSICKLRFGIYFDIVFVDICHFSICGRERCFARQFDAMHEFGMCRKQGTHVSTLGPSRRDFNPGGRMSTAGLSSAVVKEARDREFVRIASML